MSNSQARPDRMTARERAARMRAEQARRERRRAVVRRGALVGGAVAIAGGIITTAVLAGSRGGDISDVATFTDLRRDHVQTPVAYPQTPPMGGKHAPVWLNCGIYDQPVPSEQAVHSLEHGAVWITYRPDLPSAQVGRLRDLVKGHQFALLSPLPGLKAPVGASAWGKQLVVHDASDPRLKQFLATYEHGPQTPEPGAPCAGGVGTPIG